MNRDEARRLGIPDGMYPAFRHMSAEQARTQTCDDCGKVMAVHPDARWRFQNHVIRCVPCQKTAQEAGCTPVEAMLVS